MNELPRQKLCELVAKYGESVCDNPARCEGLLRDVCPHDRREVYVLANALKARIGTDLRNLSSSVPIEMTLARLTKRLEDEQGLSREMARWAVESWALALGKISERELSKQQPAPSSGHRSSSPPRASTTAATPASSNQFPHQVMHVSSDPRADNRLRNLTWALIAIVVIFGVGFAALWYFAILLPQRRSASVVVQPSPPQPAPSSTTPQPAVQPTAAASSSAIAESTPQTEPSQTPAVTWFSPAQTPITLEDTDSALSPWSGERFAETRTRLLAIDEVRGWDAETIRYAINEIYARAGYDFRTPEIKQIFLRLSWYRQRVINGRTQDEAETHLSRLEQANLELLQRVRSGRR